MEKIEYRVRPVTRFIVTRYYQIGGSGGVESKGEYDNETNAYEVAYALAKAERDRLGWESGDDRLVSPPMLPHDHVEGRFYIPPEYPDIPERPGPLFG